MNTIEQIEKRIVALEGEREQLQTAVSTLTTQREEQQEKLVSLYAQAERTPSPAATKAAEQAEKTAADLANQVGRKTAALSACNADLAQARQQLADAQQAALAGQLETVVKEARQLAGKLDANIADVTTWAALNDLYQRGRRLKHELRQASGANGYENPDPFENPLSARARLFEFHAAAADRAMGLSTGPSAKAKARAADALGLAS